MIADWALYLYLVICNECFFATFFIAMCITISWKINDFDLMTIRLEQERAIRNANQVQELYKLLSRLSKVVVQAKKTFPSPPFFGFLHHF